MRTRTKRRWSLRQATLEDVQIARELRLAAADALTRLHGEGHWSRVETLRTLRKHLELDSIFLLANEQEPIATFTLRWRKLPFYHDSWFAAPDARAVYVINMAVLPSQQRCGVGRHCMEQIEEIVRERGVEAIRLDAYQGPAGAGGFYQRCGYALRREGSLSLEFYEKLLI